MMILGWTMAFQACLLGGGDESYTSARRATLDSGKPLLVLVGAEWCGPCVKLKDQVLPDVRRKPSFAKVHFAHVDIDQERQVGRELAKGGSIPQLVLMRHTADGWKSTRLVGLQDADAIDEFLQEGIAAAEADKKSTPAKSEAAAPSKDDAKEPPKSDSTDDDATE